MKTQEINIKPLAKQCFKKVFRTTTEAPGFMHLVFDKKQLTPYQFRSIMIDLKKELSALNVSKFNKKLSYHWLVRFDQQVNTPFHVDNAADQSILLLGYEPSDIESELQLADYHKYANKAYNTQEDYFNRFTPIFKEDDALLKPFTSKIKSYDNTHYSIVIINNSNPKSNLETLGLFHKAVILNKDLSKSRIVNSMVLNVVSTDEITEDEKKESIFLNSTVISK
ncbi:hypothetical protein ULMS_06170 [Patiriisocius marinistellae]|uniref:Uncharacterized protein n=1 Tax=Patiriisocius marinistellae TaxID=2494560 RepID=A0A5J4FY88_9FLAO|nr:hypothetical protein [Patiriisocius marinistellae]GEQ85109.1 hypothetical protein ULMS_06170 [Patiriisocius marinistellae]